MTALGIAFFGGLGAVCRYVLTVSTGRWWKRDFPMATFLINALACLFIGVAMAAYSFHLVDHGVYLMFATGFLGGFSTFSTAINEIASLMRNRRWLVAACYVVASFVLPLACVTLGWWLIAVVR